MSERAIMNAVLLAASNKGWTLWRNNVGMGWAGHAEHLADGSILIREPRPLHAGLCKGSSDLIGFRPLIVSAEHLGQTIAQFSAVEVKGTHGRESAKQANFRRFVNEAGGVSIIAKNPGDIPCVV